MALGVTTFKVPTALTLSADVWQVLGLNQKYGSLGKPLGRQILRGTLLGSKCVPSKKGVHRPVGRCTQTAFGEPAHSTLQGQLPCTAAKPRRVAGWSLLPLLVSRVRRAG